MFSFPLYFASGIRMQEIAKAMISKYILWVRKGLRKAAQHCRVNKDVGFLFPLQIRRYT